MQRRHRLLTHASTIGLVLLAILPLLVGHVREIRAETGGVQLVIDPRDEAEPLERGLAELGRSIRARDVLRDAAARPKPRRVTPVEAPVRSEPTPFAVCSPDAPPLCKRASDCTGPVPDGARWACVKPWWAVESTARKFIGARDAKELAKTKVCAFEWAIGETVPGRHPGPGTWRRQGQERTRTELELVARTQCSGRCDPVVLGRWLGALAMRESSLRPWVTHRLSGDERANASAWAKMKAYYVGNPHYDEAERWRGRGILGQIAAFHLYTVDARAAPEELCDVGFASISYLQRSRTIANKQRALGLVTTWATIAATIGTGAIRPSARSLELVRARLRRAGVDPDARVRADDFGRPLPGGPGVGGRAAVAAARSVLSVARWSRRAPRSRA